jgi:hypothetical protein
MDDQDRLARALAAARPPAHDPLFALAVMRAAEQSRLKAELAKRLLRAAGLAAAAAALAVPLVGWVAANAEAVQSGILAAGGLSAMILMARHLAQRVTVN